jgi:GTP:adenosylcobinamide-phosphate guanylyltransferase
MYNNNFRHREEEEIRGRLGKKYNILNINFPLYRYQMHTNNKTNTSGFKKEFNKKIYNIKKKETYRRYLKYSSGVVAIIPARQGSKRFKFKNMQKVWGKPMIYWTINEAKKSSYINDIYVSSDSATILKFAKKNKVIPINRPKFLADSITPKIEAINHAVKLISNTKKINLVLSLQANSPDITYQDIDKCIDHLILNNNDEVVSVDENHNQNGAIRVMKYPYNFQKSLSTNIGFVITNISDIHYKRDLNKLKNNVKQI